MNKIFIGLFMMLMMVSSVSALSILNAGQVNFQSNNAFYSGPAFVVSGVENGGQDEVTWTIAELKNQLGDGYSYTGTGSVKGDFTNQYWQYPIQTLSPIYSARQIGVEWFLLPSSAATWCSDLGGDFVGKLPFSVNFGCVEFYESGKFYTLNSGTYKYNLDYSLTIDGKGTDKISLSETTPKGGNLIGSKNYFVAVVQTHGVSKRSDPTIPTEMSLVYSLKDSRWTMLNKITSTTASQVGFSVLSQSYSDCWNTVSVSNQIEKCNADWDAKVAAFMSANALGGSSFDRTKISFNQLSTVSFSGNVTYNDGNIYREPIVTLTLNADAIGVKRTYGIGDIVSVTAPSQMIIGQSSPLSITLKNVGDAQLDGVLNYQCSAYSISGITQSQVLAPGASKTLTGSITYTGSATGCQAGSKCILTYGNRNAVTFDDKYEFTPQVCQPNECNTEGKTECIGNVVRKCERVNTILKYNTISTCPDGCEYLNSNAVCKDVKPVCGNYICELGESEGEENYCPTDCKPYIPVCGDLTCDSREQARQEYECLEGVSYSYRTNEKGDCPVGPPDDPEWGWIIFGSITGLGLIGAIAYRLKKEGYFKK